MSINGMKRENTVISVHQSGLESALLKSFCQTQILNSLIYLSFDVCYEYQQNICPFEAFFNIKNSQKIT